MDEPDTGNYQNMFAFNKKEKLTVNPPVESARSAPEQDSKRGGEVSYAELDSPMRMTLKTQKDASSSPMRAISLTVTEVEAGLVH